GGHPPLRDSCPLPRPPNRERLIFIRRFDSGTRQARRPRLGRRIRKRIIPQHGKVVLRILSESLRGECLETAVNGTRKPGVLRLRRATGVALLRSDVMKTKKACLQG